MARHKDTSKAKGEVMAETAAAPETEPKAPPDKVQDLSGKTLGDFKVLQPLGEGSMGQVYLAEQLSLGRKVALKVMRSHLVANDNAMKRFRAEAEVVARLSHTNIVQVHAIGEQEGIRFIAMEYVDGPNLATYLAKKGPLPVPLAVSIMRQVSRAIQESGEQGIVHRDLKPANIMVSRKGVVKVTDFSMARWSARALHLTQTGVIMGTPLYMSPEQVMGQDIDPRSDIYSFGATSYHLLAGKPPFMGKSPIEVAFHHVETQPPPLTDHRGDLPAELIDIVMKMMAKKPADRYQNGKEVSLALNRVKIAEGAENLPATMALEVRGQKPEVRDPDPERAKQETAIKIEKATMTVKPVKPADRKRDRPDGLPLERLHELSGTKLSYFEVGKVLGQSRTGLVFEARDLKAERSVALKVLPPHFTRDEEAMQRFVQAMKTMLQLQHPNLINLYGAGKTGPYCWVSREYIKGESLTEVIQRIGTAGMLDWRDAYRVALHIGRGLAFAHGQHIIHRNITSQNIMVRGSDRVAKLGDLMLAKALDGNLAESSSRPDTPANLSCMAPEQAAGAHVDARCDLYSLGALVYTMLTGRPPHGGGALVEALAAAGPVSMAELARMKQGDPVRPKVFHMAVSDHFEGIVMKLLAARPEDRYQTAAQLMIDLERMAKYQGLE